MGIMAGLWGLIVPWIFAVFDLFDGRFAEDDLVAIDLGVGFLGGFGDGFGVGGCIDGLGGRVPEVAKELADGSGDWDVLWVFHALF